MNLQFYLEKVHDSEELQDFMIENPDAYICSCFFDINGVDKSSEDKQHIDFYSPTLKKIFSFKIEEGCTKESLENFKDEAPKKLGLDFDLDFEDLEKKILAEMEEKKINKQIQKLLISLQKIENKDMVVVTVFISGLGMLKVIFEPVSKKIVEFEKKSFFDIMKVTRKKN